MKVEQIYTGCLAQGAYYISSDGEAAIIDPLREVQPYLDRATRDEVNIKYVFETHFHADFVSGHLDLSQKSGAAIVFGPTAQPTFEAIIATNNQEFKIGNCTIKVLHTPGHTMESSCYLLIDENGKETALFSGDTLFLGDVGRPDLAQKAANFTQEELAGLLYESLYNKILPLADDILVYPAHGAGSACGKNMMKETVDRLGNQKKVNYALNQASKDDFIKAVTDGLMPPPAYFPANVAMNKKGYESFDAVLNNGMRALNVEEFVTIAENLNAVVLDTRNATNFAQGFVPKSINIGLKGDFAPWVGAIISDVKQPILIITDEGSEEEAVTRLSRVGFDQLLGYLQGGFESWKTSGNEVDKINRISAEAFKNEFDDVKSTIIDVRKESEYKAQHVENAYNKPLAIINSWFETTKNLDEFYIHCGGGYRSMIAASILKARGIHHFKEIDGGFAAISNVGVPTSDFVCQSKLVS